ADRSRALATRAYRLSRTASGSPDPRSQGRRAMSCSWLRGVVMLGFGLLPACGASPPTRFYILNDIAPTAQPAAVSNRTAVRVEPPALAPELDRPELVTRSGANRVHVAGLERWAAPLPGQIRRVLSDDLAARLPPGLVA